MTPDVEVYALYTDSGVGEIRHSLNICCFSFMELELTACGKYVSYFVVITAECHSWSVSGHPPPPGQLPSLPFTTRYLSPCPPPIYEFYLYYLEMKVDMGGNSISLFVLSFGVKLVDYLHHVHLVIFLMFF